jgi:hypothetical protein
MHLVEIVDASGCVGDFGEGGGRSVTENKVQSGFQTVQAAHMAVSYRFAKELVTTFTNPPLHFYPPIQKVHRHT